MVEREPAYLLPMLLFAGFRTLIDELHAELAAQGHPHLRPAMGFAMQAIGTAGATATEVGQRLGVSKQAAGKTIDRMAELGYVERVIDASDARRRTVRLTRLGVDALERSARIFEQLRAGWDDTLGERRVRDLEIALGQVTAGRALRLDVPGWLSP